MRAISACQYSPSRPAVGLRRSIRDMRAALLIWMPTGQGMQYPQPRQKSPTSSVRSLSMKAAMSSVITGGASWQAMNSSSSRSRWMPQMGSTGYCARYAQAASARVMRPPESAFMQMKPTSCASHRRTRAISFSLAR